MCKNVLINIKNVKIYANFIIVKESNYNVLFKMLFQFETKLRFTYSENNVITTYFTNAKKTAKGSVICAKNIANYVYKIKEKKSKNIQLALALGRLLRLKLT